MTTNNFSVIGWREGLTGYPEPFLEDKTFEQEIDEINNEIKVFKTACRVFDICEKDRKLCVKLLCKLIEHTTGQTQKIYVSALAVIVNQPENF